MPTTVELIRDEQAEIAESGFILDPARHHVIRVCPWADFLNRMAKRNDLFVYHHLEHGNYVLCSWLIPGLSCVELTVFDVPPGHFDTDAPNWSVVKEIIRPAREKIEKARKEVLEAQAAKAAIRFDSALEKVDRARVLRMKGMESAATLLESSRHVGEKEGGANLLEARERMTTAAKLADRSDGPWYDHLKPKAAPAPTPSE